jgi:malic enzyme
MYSDFIYILSKGNSYFNAQCNNTAQFPYIFVYILFAVIAFNHKSVALDMAEEDMMA